MATTLEGVRTRFPCGPNAGKLADRYSSYDKIPLLKRIGSNAIQCGAAGYWYVDADLSARLRDAVDIATGQTWQVIDDVGNATSGIVASVGKWAIATVAGYALIQALFNKRGGNRGA